MNGDFYNCTFLVVVTSADLKKPIAMQSLGADGANMAMLVKCRGIYVCPNQENGLQDVSKIPLDQLAKAKSLLAWQLAFENAGVQRLDG